ncbi:MAG: type IV pilus assembly protein PilM [Bdellovibrionales bacterium]|nr:type IV pilus assembly protein PilM [Bdellovibrionales bacterium]
MIFGGRQLIGLDIGSSSIKMIELKATGKTFKINRFGMAPLPPGLVEGGEVLDPGVLSGIISGLHKELGLRTKHVCSGMFGGAVIVKKISIPRIDPKLISEQIKWEAEQYIPFDLSEVNLDYHLLKSNQSSETMDILLVAAKQDFIIRYYEAIESAGLHCSIIDVNGFALANCFEMNYGARNGQTLALINIGSGVSNLVIVDNGEVVFCRDIPIGGNLYNMEIARELGVSQAEAEDLKIGSTRASESPPELSAVISATNEMICDEIRNSFDFYDSSNSGPEVGSIFLSGGSIHIPQLVEAIANGTQKDCQVLNPLQNVEYSAKEFSPDYMNQIAPFLAVSIGLAARKVGDS